MKGVWSSLRPPIRVLAPMEDVTDHVFRDLIARLGAPDLYVTEFILADVVAGLSPYQLALRRHPHHAGRPGDGGATGNTRGGPGPGASPRPGDGGAAGNALGGPSPGGSPRPGDGGATGNARGGPSPGGSPRPGDGGAKLPGRLRWGTEDTPLIAQIWGTRPESYRMAAENLRILGFDGVDINMGCPIRKIRKHGACSQLISNPTLAAELIAAAKEGAGTVPVSVKTRIGLDRPVTEEWAGFLLDQGPAALTIHGRTADEMSDGLCRWEEIRRVVEIRNAGGYQTLIIGNGDVRKREEFAARVEETGVDGVMVGRGIFEDPYIFGESGRISDFRSRSREEKLQLLLYHLRAFRTAWEKERNYEIMKKFYKIYLVGFEDAEQIRERLNETGDFDSAEVILKEYITCGDGGWMFESGDGG